MPYTAYPDEIDNPYSHESPDVYVADPVIRIEQTHQRLSNNQPAASPSSGGTVTPDCSAGLGLVVNMPVTLAPSITIANPTNARDGDVLTLVIVQGTMGLGTVTWGSQFRHNVTLSTGAGQRDSLCFKFFAADTLWYQVASSLNV